MVFQGYYRMFTERLLPIFDHHDIAATDIFTKLMGKVPG